MFWKNIGFVRPSSGRDMPWLFQSNGQDLDVVVPSRVSVQEDVLGCLSYALGGGGLLQTYHFIAQRHLADGSLLEVMQPWGGRLRPFTLLYPHNRHLSAKVRAFVQFLTQQLVASVKVHPV